MAVCVFAVCEKLRDDRRTRRRRAEKELENRTYENDFRRETIIMDYYRNNGRAVVSMLLLRLPVGVLGET